MSDPVGLRVVRIHPRAALPHYASDGAAGLDLTAAIDAPIVLASLERAKVPTGLVIGLPPGHEGQVRPRSGLAAKHGLTVLNAPGTIDEDYRGELAVLLVNLSQDEVTIQPGERIAQLVVAQVTRVAVGEVLHTDELGSTARGTGGFGSTGRT
ncbi:MAG: Deoxyuridine 5-triphosphate nucleotidohydrolase [Myxococcaceae bacterium]|nr:Deoxyuridine 5-triphosphate nucleotidohydrolase [Myxococcaceae bacterium]